MNARTKSNAMEKMERVAAGLGEGGARQGTRRGPGPLTRVQGTTVGRNTTWLRDGDESLVDKS
jgi:hypothetical protein